MALISRKDEPTLPHALPGFSHINRYWDRTNDCFSAKILPGEYYVTKTSERIVTVLGSCVSACIRDSKLGIGGMNHFMLPQSSIADIGGTSDFGILTRFGNVAMERMINDILKNGGLRKNLEVKLFGGGNVLVNMADIGRKNIEFVREFVDVENMLLLAEDLGDIYPRKVQYVPATGKVYVKRLKSAHNDTIVQRERKYMTEIEAKPIDGEIDLF